MEQLTFEKPWYKDGKFVHVGYNTENYIDMMEFICRNATSITYGTTTSKEANNRHKYIKDLFRYDRCNIFDLRALADMLSVVPKKRGTIDNLSNVMDNKLHYLPSHLHSCIHQSNTNQEFGYRTITYTFKNCSVVFKGYGCSSSIPLTESTVIERISDLEMFIYNNDIKRQIGMYVTLFLDNESIYDSRVNYITNINQFRKSGYIYFNRFFTDDRRGMYNSSYHSYKIKQALIACKYAACVTEGVVRSRGVVKDNINYLQSTAFKKLLNKLLAPWCVSWRGIDIKNLYRNKIMEIVNNAVKKIKEEFNNVQD